MILMGCVNSSSNIYYVYDIPTILAITGGLKERTTLS